MYCALNSSIPVVYAVADYESFLALEEGLGLQPVGPFELEVARVISSIFTLVSKKPGGKYSVPSKEDFVL